MRKLALALTALGAFTFGSAAQAEISITDPTSVTIGNPGIDESTDIQAFTFGFAQSGLSNPFTATLSFMNQLAGQYSFQLGTIANTSGGANDLDFTSAVLTGTGLGSAGISFNRTSGDNDLIENLVLQNIDLAAGNYTLTVMGTTSGRNGSFSGSTAFTAAAATGAVPEPATWAMMLLGFGAVGYGMRRQRRSSMRLLQAA